MQSTCSGLIPDEFNEVSGSGRRTVGEYHRETKHRILCVMNCCDLFLLYVHHCLFIIVAVAPCRPCKTVKTKLSPN